MGCVFGKCSICRCGRASDSSSKAKRESGQLGVHGKCCICRRRPLSDSSSNPKRESGQQGVHAKCCICRRRRPSDSNSKAKRESGQQGVQGIPVFAERSLDDICVPSHNFSLEYSVLTQRGYYPDSPDKENQDSFCIKTQVHGNPNIHYFGVFDGHGLFGTQCSNFVKDILVEKLANDPLLSEDPVRAYKNAFVATNDELHGSDIDDSMSGTTAITALVVGDTLYVANVGDSRAVIAMKDGNQIVAQDLSHDQTPFRKDEYERVKLCGARVLSVDQVEGLKDPNIQTWGDEETEGGDPPRLWVQNGMYPGTAFTRSVGDSTAESIGVIAVPEISVVQLKPEHLFFVVASDGVFEFLSSQAVVNLVARFPDPREACSAIAGESYKLWLENENRAKITAGSSRADEKPTIVGAGNGASDTSATSISDFDVSTRSASSDMQQSKSFTSVDQTSAKAASSYADSQPT